MRAVRLDRWRGCSEAYILRWVSAGAFAATLAALVASCSVNGAPSADEVRSAYLRHLKQDALEAQWFGGTEADHSGIPISAERPDCDSDGDGHYHCRVRFAVETARGRTTIERALHMVRDRDGWVVDSVE